MNGKEWAKFAIDLGCYILFDYGCYKLGERFGDWVGRKIANKLHDMELL